MRRRTPDTITTQKSAETQPVITYKTILGGRIDMSRRADKEMKETVHSHG